MTARRGFGLAPASLPHAAALTDLLLGASAGAGAAAPGDPAGLARRLARRLAEAAGGGSVAGRRGRPGGRRAGPAPLRVTGYLLRTTAADRSVDQPFAWSPATARRTIGLAAVRTCLGTPQAPAEAVAGVVASLAADGRHGLGRSGSLADWLGRLPTAARAVVEAEAVTWATRLWTAVEWERVGPTVRVGGRDRLWAPAGVPDIGLRGRVDVEVPAAGTLRGTGGAFLTLLPGCPGPASRVELGLAALVAALAVAWPTGRPGAVAAAGGVPARVAGWWPDCGRALVVPVDGPLLDETADAVVQAVAATRRRPAGRVGGAVRVARSGTAGRPVAPHGEQPDDR